MPVTETNVGPKPSALERDTVRVNRITVTDERYRDLEAWLKPSVEARISERNVRLERIDRWRKTLAGENPEPRPRPDYSHVSVPISLWARTAVHGRIVQSIFQHRSAVKMDLFKAEGDVNDALRNAVKRLAKFTDTQIRDPRGLNGRDATKRYAAEATDTGLGALLVMIEEDKILNLPPVIDGGDPERVVRFGSVRWEPISNDDLLYYDGYGPDANAMPFVGYTTDKRWHAIQSWANLNHYDKDQVERIKGYYTSLEDTSEPPEMHRHLIAELYLDYDIDGDGILEPLVVDLHVRSGIVLRVAWNRFDGYRPIVLTQFDLPSDSRKVQGQGICEKLESPQTETNAIHNIGIEAGKRAIGYVSVAKAGRLIGQQLEGVDYIMPGDLFFSEDPEEDLVTKPLGDPRSIEPMLLLEDLNRGYVARLLGLDEARLGNVEAGKRVPASLGLSISREGRVPIMQAIENITNSLTEAVYLTLQAWQRRVPINAMREQLDDETIALLQGVVFGPGSERDVARKRIKLTISAQDVATALEDRKNELMVLNNFLIAFYERMAQSVLLISNPQVPPSAKPILTQVLDRMQNSVRKLLETLESVDDPGELLIEMSALTSLINEAGSVGSGPPRTSGDAVARTQPIAPPAQAEDETDEGEIAARLGGGNM